MNIADTLFLMIDILLLSYNLAHCPVIEQLVYIFADFAVIFLVIGQLPKDKNLCQR